MLENKLGITNSVDLAHEEERITKLKALKLFDTNKIDEFEIGTFKGLACIHKYLFDDIYSFAGKIRKENIAKGNFRFASCMYLEDVLHHIANLPQDTLNLILKKELNKVIDWSKVNKEDYLLAMERSPVKDLEIRLLLQNALTDKINDRQVFMKGIDSSYEYEGYNAYPISELDKK